MKTIEPPKIERYQTPEIEEFEIEMKAAVMSGEGGGEGNGEDGEV